MTRFFNNIIIYECACSIVGKRPQALHNRQHLPSSDVLTTLYIPSIGSKPLCLLGSTTCLAQYPYLHVHIVRLQQHDPLTPYQPRRLPHHRQPLPNSSWSVGYRKSTPCVALWVLRLCQKRGNKVHEVVRLCSVKNSGEGCKALTALWECVQQNFLLSDGWKVAGREICCAKC